MAHKKKSKDVEIIKAGHGWVIRQKYYIRGLVTWCNTYVVNMAEALTIFFKLRNANNKKSIEK